MCQRMFFQRTLNMKKRVYNVNNIFNVNLQYIFPHLGSVVYLLNVTMFCLHPITCKSSRPEVFLWTCFVTLLKSHFLTVVFLEICCIFPEHLFTRTPLRDCCCFWISFWLFLLLKKTTKVRFNKKIEPNSKLVVKYF